MEELMVKKPDIKCCSAVIECNFEITDTWIDELEKRYAKLVVDATDKDQKAEAKEICSELNKVKKELEDFGVKTEKNMSVSIKEFRAELKKRTERIGEIRKPLYEQVKPQPKPKPEKKSIHIKACYIFEGDSEYISNMIAAAEFNNIEVTELIDFPVI